MAERKDTNPVELPNAPVVAEAISDPRAIGYAAAVAARRGGAQKYSTPVGGGPSPHLPLFDQPHQGGMTIADHAQKPLPVPQGGILQPRPAPPPPAPEQPRGFAYAPAPPRQTTAQSLAQMGILPTDVLPDIARQDPKFQSGMGSMAAAAQPELALRYGVIRNGAPLAPQQLQTGKPGLRKETIDDLKMLADFNKTRASVGDAAAPGDVLAAQDAQAEKEVAAGPAGAAAKLAGPQGMGPPQTPLERVDKLELNRFIEMEEKDLLNNEEQRKMIEERCKPMTLEELIMNERATQIVPIQPGVLEPEFQSMTYMDELTIKRLIVQEAKQLEVTDRYLLDKYSMMSLTVGLKALNKVELPSHTDQEGNFDEKAFWVKFNRVMKLPLHLVASLAINFFWFEVRVRRLHVTERLKNG